MLKAANSRWTTVQYSEDEINDAGEKLRTNDFSIEQLKIVNNWRAAHAFPLHVIYCNIRDKAKRINTNALIVQRLKKLESTIFKLIHNNKVNLYEMQDLGGCRVIVPTIDIVRQVVDKYKKSDIKHKLVSENDYIGEPKIKSGYRSHHLVYEYHSDKNPSWDRNKHLLIEIQVRTILQHLWATAVEVAGQIRNQAFKSSKGDKNYLEFFKLVSSLFALEEHTPPVLGTPKTQKEIIEKIKKLDAANHIISNLNAVTEASQIALPNKGHDGDVYVLELDLVKNEVQIHVFSRNMRDKAIKKYEELENSNDNNINVVLVEANSLDDLKRTYPNYYNDIKEFMTKISSYMK